MKSGLLLRIAVVCVMAFAGFNPLADLFACDAGPAIVLQYPKENADVGAQTKEITIRWHIENRRCPLWGVEVWCASDNECIFNGTVKEGSGGTNEVTVTGLKPNRLYFIRLERNWARIKTSHFTTGKLFAEKAAKLPERFYDKSRYDIVDMPRNEAFDLALTRFRGFTRGVMLDRSSRARLLSIVPCRQYSTAWVLCSIDPDAAKDKFFTLRLTRYVTRLWRKMRARSIEAMCNCRVDLNGAGSNVTQLGNGLALVEVPLDTVGLQDVIFHDKEGDWDDIKDELRQKGLENYLDIELLGRTPEYRSGAVDGTADIDFAYTSAVTVHGIALEKPGVEFETKTIQPGNIFAGKEKPQGMGAVRIFSPGEYKLAVEVSDVDGRYVGRVERKVSKTGEYVLNFPNNGEGWYSLKWLLSQNNRVIFSHNASFAVLGEDTRTTEMGEQYGTWAYLTPYGTHGYPAIHDGEGVDYVCSVLQKGGFRLTTIQQPPYDEQDRIKRYKGKKNTLTDEECRKYKLGAPNVVSYPHDWRAFCSKGGKAGEEKLAAVIRERLKRNPHCLVAKLFHENASYGSVAPEAFGFQPNEKERSHSANLVPGAVDFCKFLRKNFPQIRIVVGNSASISEFVAELARNGLTEELVDDMGMEVIGGETLPEMPTASGMLGAEHFRALAANMNLDWGVDQCFESNMRQDKVLGQEGQASFYVRDILLSHIWGFKSIWIGAIADQGNHYNLSKWGNIGLCSRFPYMYPKLSYVAAATATKVLDRVTAVKKIPSGEETVYVVEFIRADGNSATAFWASRGTAKLSVELQPTITPKDVVFVDMYGRNSKFNGVVDASERVMYLIGKVGHVKSVGVVGRSFPQDAKPADYTKVAVCDDVSAWQVASKQYDGPGLEHDFEKSRSWPHRTFMPGAIRFADDPEMGKCIEFELVDDGKSVSEMHYRYNELTLKRPIKIGRAFKSIGATVKGNSGWGEVVYILEDSKGRRSYSGYTRNQGVMDRYGYSVVNYSGWNFLRLYVSEGSSVRERKCGKPRWAWTQPEVASDPDVKLVGIGFAARMRPLFINETKPIRQVIRVKDIGVFD